MLGAISAGDETGAGAWLEALENSQRNNMDDMKKMISSLMNSQQLKQPISRTVSPEVVMTSVTQSTATPVPTPRGLSPACNTTYSAATGTFLQKTFLPPGALPSVSNRQPRQNAVNNAREERTSERSPSVKWVRMLVSEESQDQGQENYRNPKVQ